MKLVIIVWFGLGLSTMACTSPGASSASGDLEASESSLAMSCALHYFDAATATKIFPAASGSATLSSLRQTPLVLTTPENVTAKIWVLPESGTLLGIEESAGGQQLGGATYHPLFPSPIGLASKMPPVVKGAVTYDSVWVGCHLSPGAIPPPPGTDRRESQAQSIEAFVDALASFTAWPETVDGAALKARERATIVGGDGSDAVFFGSAWRTLNAYPQGHQWVGFQDGSACGKTVALMKTSRFGVCGRPSAAGLVVTVANPENKLGLAVGDVILDADGDSGDALFTKAYERPMCSDIFPAPSGRRSAGAATFFGSVPPNTKLTVAAPSGATRTVSVPAESDEELTSCTDPFGRNLQIYAEAKVRPDGVAVIRLPSFAPYDKAFPDNATQADLDAFRAAYQADIQKVFDSVKTAPGIIWDVRGNAGGLTDVGLAIVSGFPTAMATPLSYCLTRAATSNPPTYVGPRFANYAITPGGPFAYTGKVAVVTDGLAYSAAEYFSFAAVKGGNAIVVGSATAGAFGGSRDRIDIAGPPALTSNYDPDACFDAATHQHLEAAPLPPTVAVELDPKDVAAGLDTVLERAVKELGF